ncbi:MAG: hypothetical protein ACFB21_00005 [Opitutales bacterium]
MSSRFVPSIRQLETAAEMLPNPDSWPDDVYVVPIGKSERQRLLTFRRVEFNQRDGEVAQRWLYEGKVLIQHYVSGSDAEGTDGKKTTRRRRRSSSSAGASASSEKAAD